MTDLSEPFALTKAHLDIRSRWRSEAHALPSDRLLSLVHHLIGRRGSREPGAYGRALLALEVLGTRGAFASVEDYRSMPPDKLAEWVKRTAFDIGQ